MSRTFKTKRFYSTGTPNIREEYSSCSGNIAMNSPQSNRSKYTQSNYESRQTFDEVPALDIRNIDHEAIRNDPELRSLSRNPSAFNRYPIHNYDEYESDGDIYADVEMLENNPAEEYRLRSLYSSTDNSRYNEQLYTPSLVRSYNTHHSESLSSRKGDDIEEDIEDEIEVDVKEQQEPPLSVSYKALKATAFVLFMVYWVVSEPIIRTMAFVTMVFSAMVFDPMEHIWSKLAIPKNLIYLQRGIKYVFSLILLSLCLIPIQSVARPYFDASLSLYYRSNKSLSQLESAVETVTTDNKAIWSSLEKIKNAELKNIWDKLKDHQAQINSLRDSIDEKITYALKAKLPEMILVQTNDDGDLEISPKFFTYLQDSLSWDDFLLQNNQSIVKYISGFDPQEKKGAIINKSTFLKLLLNVLLYHQSPIAENAEVSFDNLVNNAIKRYHQDVLNTADFALESRGAKILESLTSPTFYSSPNWKRSMRHFVGLHVPVNPPRFAITSTTHAGECWSMLGSHGNLTVKLSEPVTIQSITIEYPSAEVMMNNMATAPKEISVYGINHYHQSAHPNYLGHFTYDINKDSPIQTFDIVVPQESTYRAVTFKISSNWGSEERTDIYRVRVHGVPDIN